MQKLHLIALTILLATGLARAQDARIGVAEEFETIEGWRANNPKARDPRV